MPAVTKIDCAEFQHSHEIARLIGSPYLGHRETHPLLSQETFNQFHTATVKLSLILSDEIENASDALWNPLLGILDKGALTLGDNRKVDFSRSELTDLPKGSWQLPSHEMSELIHRPVMSPNIVLAKGAIAEAANKQITLSSKRH